MMQDLPLNGTCHPTTQGLLLNVTHRGRNSNKALLFCDIADLHEDLVVPLAVCVQPVHQLLPGGSNQVLGQRQVPDGSVCCLI